MTDNQRKRKAPNTDHNAANRLRQPFNARSSICDASLVSYQTYHYGAPAASQEALRFDTAPYLGIDASNTTNKYSDIDHNAANRLQQRCSGPSENNTPWIADPPLTHSSLATYQTDDGPALNFEPYGQPASLYFGTSAGDFNTVNRHTKHLDVDHNGTNYRPQPHYPSSVYNGSIANTAPQMAGPRYGTHLPLARYPMVGAPAANLAPYDQLPSLFLDTHHLDFNGGDFHTTSQNSSHWNTDYNTTNYLLQPQNASSIYHGPVANTSYATPQTVDPSHSAHLYQRAGAPSANFGPYDQQASLFAGAHHFGIETATFNTTNNNITSAHPSTVDPYSILHRAIAIEATQTSKTAQYAPKCHPKTRTKIIADIVDMVETGEKPIIWFSGPAGGGKTCIMREVADRCQSKGRPTCTYFFSTRVPGLSTSTPFVATIANQLLVAFPAIRPSILGTISTYPTIFQHSLDFQMDKLIIEPLASSTPDVGSKVVVVIDGYDECTDVKERQHLLRLLEFLDEKVPQSIVIVIASRPELDIRTSFDNPHLKSITCPVLLHSYDGKSDVLIYFADEFERIRQTHPRKAQIPEGWPFEEIVHTLIDKSSGNFVLPSTTIKYISNLRRSPVEMLEKVLEAFSLPTDDNPLAELDALYTLILHPPDTEIPLLKRILHWIIAMRETASESEQQPSVRLLDKLMQLPSGTVGNTLCDLHSVVKVPPPGVPVYISFHHKSLEDFLLSPGRSRDLFQELYETHLDLALVCSQHPLAWVANPTDGFDIALAHATDMWGDHVDRFLEVKPSSVVIPDAILQFDPRIIARSGYVFGDDPANCRSPSFVLSNDGVPKSICWCFVNFPVDLWEHPDYEQNAALLPHFDIKSGLYDEDEIDGLSYPVGHRLLAFKLETIRDTHPLKTLIPDDWPIKELVNALVCKDHTDLLVPSLIVQYLKHPHHNPIESLERAISVLSSIPSSSEGPKAQLDAIYTLILHPPEPNIPLIKRLLHCMIGLSQARKLGRYHGATRYDLLLDLPAGASKAALLDIDSALFLFDGYRESFYPRSLEDYLLSPDRSKDMFQSEQETHLNIILAQSHLLQKWGELPWSPGQERYPMAWGFHFEKAMTGALSIPDALVQFDLRLVWRYVYCYDCYSVSDNGAMEVLGPSHIIQSQHCTDAVCSWCRVWDRIKNCTQTVEAIFSADKDLPDEDRLKNLPRFDTESGLYDDDEIDQLSYPVGRRLLAVRAETQAQTSLG